MTTQRRRFYTDSNGDKWFLCRARDGAVVVSYEPNATSKAKGSQVDVGEFLAKKNKGPEQECLRHLIAELVDPDHAPSKSQLAGDKVRPAKPVKKRGLTLEVVLPARAPRKPH